MRGEEKSPLLKDYIPNCLGLWACNTLNISFLLNHIKRQISHVFLFVKTCITSLHLQNAVSSTDDFAMLSYQTIGQKLKKQHCVLKPLFLPKLNKPHTFLQCIFVHLNSYIFLNDLNPNSMPRNETKQTKRIAHDISEFWVRMNRGGNQKSGCLGQTLGMNDVVLIIAHVPFMRICWSKSIFNLHIFKIHILYGTKQFES